MNNKNDKRIYLYIYINTYNWKDQKKYLLLLQG